MLAFSISAQQSPNRILDKPPFHLDFFHTAVRPEFYMFLWEDNLENLHIPDCCASESLEEHTPSTSGRRHATSAGVAEVMAQKDEGVAGGQTGVSVSGPKITMLLLKPFYALIFKERKGKFQGKFCNACPSLQGKITPPSPLLFGTAEFQRIHWNWVSFSCGVQIYLIWA